MSKKQILSLLLAFVMVLGLCPVPANAAEAATPTEETVAVVTEAPTEAATEEATEVPTEAAIEEATEAPTEAATEEATETPEAATEETTEAVTEEATEAPTETAAETTAAAEEPAEEPEDISLFAMAESAASTVDWDSAVTVDVTLSDDASFQVGPGSKVVMAKTHVTVPYFDLANYGLQDLYFRSEDYNVGDLPNPDPTTYTGKVTLLHVFLFMTEVYYCGIAPEAAGQGYLKTSGKMSDLMDVGGSAGSAFIQSFWGGDYNLNYYVNHEFPLAGPGMGATCDQVLMYDGDDVAVAHYSSFSFFMDSGMGFHYFVTDAGAESAAVDQGTQLKLNVKRATGTDGPTNHLTVDKQPAIYYAAADQLPGGDPAAWTCIGNADASGVITVDTAAMAPGKYVIAMAGGFGNENPGDVVSSPGAFRLTVKPAAVETQKLDYTVDLDKTKVAPNGMIHVTINGTSVKTTDLSFTLHYDPAVFTLSSAEPMAADLQADTTKPGTVTFTRTADAPFQMDAGTWASVSLTANAVPGATELTFAGTAKDADVTVPGSQTVTVTEAPKFDGIFHAELQYSAPGSLGANENARVLVCLSDPAGAQQTYNSYDILLTYAEGLEVSKITAIDKNATVEHDPVARTLHVVGYGEPKDIRTAPVSFYVSAPKTGTYPVTLTHVKADVSEGAIGSDTPECVLDTASADVIVDETLVRYTVTVNGELTGELVAGGEGIEHTWELPAPKPGMTYKVTYTMGDDPTVHKAAVFCDETGGAYTIGNVTGNLNITIEQVPDSPDAIITVQGTGAADVKAPAKVKKEQSFSFTIDRKPGYAYTLDVVISGYHNSEYTVSGNTYTIPSGTVTGDVEIIVTKTPVLQDQFAVSFTGNCVTQIKGDPIAAKGADYTFSIENNNCPVTVKATMGGAEVQVEDDHNNNYTIRNVTGELVIDVMMTYPSYPVTVEGTGAEDVKAPTEATQNTDYIFRVNKDPNFSYEINVVDADSNPVYFRDNGDGTYTVDGCSIYQGFTITVNRTTLPPIDVQVVKYLQMDGSNLFLITATAEGAAGMSFAGEKMFWSETYKAYCWLVSSAESLEAVLNQAKTQVARADMPTGTIVCDGDVNKTGFVDVNDAQLTYDLYNLRYTDFTKVSMEKFLRADVNGDKTIDVADAAAVVNTLMKK